MAHLSIRLLGPFSVHLDDQPVSGFVSDKVRALLAYLVTESDRAFRRETLAGLLWPDVPEASARNSLRTALVNLRTVIGDRAADPPFLHISRTTLQFNVDSDYWLDVRAFDARVSSPTHTPHQEGVVQTLEEAVGLYRSSFLEGFSLADSVAFEDWALIRREQLQRQVLEALNRLAMFHEQRAEYGKALPVAWRQVELDPWREEAQRQLMRVLAQSGQKSTALAQYEACRQVLAEELGVEPGAETVALYEQIRAGTVQPAAAGIAPASPPTPPTVVQAPRHNLPAQLTPFIGREALLAEIAARLQDPACRLLTLVGPGGSGKTRLAQEAAADQLYDYDNGVFFVALAPVQSAEGIVPAVAQALGCTLYGGSDPRQQLLDYLQQKEMLLVLDNAEHLLAEHLIGFPKGRAVGVVTDILGAAPEVRILVTSRACLQMQGEQLLPVEGMGFPEEALATAEAQQIPAVAAQYSAVTLFVQSARRVRPRFELTADNLPHIVQICRLVQGMPLGILLAASWVKMLSPSEIAAQVAGHLDDDGGQGLDFLETDWRDVPARQRSMRAVFDHSWSLLAARERAVMRSVSVFRGGFTQQAAQQVAVASLRDLMALIDKSLLHRTPSGRYEMHELLRQYGVERLEESVDGGQAARDRHAAYYAAALQRWSKELEGPRQMEALQEIEVEFANARTAWEWAAARGRADWLEQATDGMDRFVTRRWRYSEGIELFQVATERLCRTHNDPRALSIHQQRVLARLWAWEGHVCWTCVRYERASQVWRQSQELLAQLERAGSDVRSEKAFVLWQATALDRYVDDLERCRSRLEQSLALYRELGAHREAASVLCELGRTLHVLGHPDQAVQMLREALAIRQELGDPSGIADALDELGWLLNRRGERAKAESMMRKSLALARTLGDPFIIDWKLRSMYLLLADQGQFAKAYSLARQSLATLREHQTWFFLWAFSVDISHIELHLGRYAEARLDAEAGLAMARKRGSHWQLGLALLRLGQVAMGERALSEAKSWLQEALAAHFEPLLRWRAAQTHAALGGVALQQGDPEAAQRHLGQALRQVTEPRSVAGVRFILPFVARLLAQQGQVERAVEIYALASHFPYVANSRWFEDVAGRQISASAEALPPEVVAAARKHGQERDLWATVEELLAEWVGEDDECPA